MPLFLVAILKQPMQKQKEEGATESLILPPTPVVAANDKSAAIVAVQTQKLTEDLSNVEVLVRPF